jgi:hypothetical protein
LFTAILTEMKKLYLKIVLFLSPLILNAILVFLVDPYNFFNISHIIPDEGKEKCYRRTMESVPRGSICWKINEYMRNPSDYVLLGDSRMARMNSEISRSIIGVKVYNFTVPGGNYRTLKDIFDIVTQSNKHLKELYIELVFLNFNQNVNYDLLPFLTKFQNKPLTYLYDKNIIRDTWVNLYYYFSENEDYISLSVREKDVDEWKRASRLIDERLSNFKYPDNYVRDLYAIKAYCEKNHIALYFILPPTYVEFDKRVEEKGLTQEYQDFHSLVRSLGSTVDLDHMHAFCSNRSNYKDYFHFQNYLLDSIAKVIWRGVKVVRDDQLKKSGESGQSDMPANTSALNNSSDGKQN